MVLFVTAALAAPNWQSDVELERKYEDVLKRNVEHFSNELMERGWFGDMWNKVKNSDLFNKVKEGGKKFLGGLFSKLAGASGGSSKREFEEAYSHMLQREMGDYEQEAIARDLQSFAERGWFGDMWNKVKNSDLFNKVKEGGKKFLGGLFSKLAGATAGGGKRELEEKNFEYFKRDMQCI